MVVVIIVTSIVVIFHHHHVTLYSLSSLQSSLSRQLVFVCRTNFAEQITSYHHLFVTNTILIACIHYNYIHK